MKTLLPLCADQNVVRRRKDKRRVRRCDVTKDGENARMHPVSVRRPDRRKRFRRPPRRRADEDDTDEETEAGEESVIQIRNTVYFHSPVTRESVLLLIQKLDEAATFALTHGTTVQLFIHSEGGDVFAGLSGMNHIQACRCRVTCIADGFVASAATFLFMGGHERRGMKHSTVLIHQLSTGFWGKFVELKDEVANSEQLMETLCDLYTTRTTLDRERVQQMLEKELTMTSQQCLDIGLYESIYNV